MAEATDLSEAVVSEDTAEAVESEAMDPSEAVDTEDQASEAAEHPAAMEAAVD